jgi:hypothetical protein
MIVAMDANKKRFELSLRCAPAADYNLMSRAALGFGVQDPLRPDL